MLTVNKKNPKRTNMAKKYNRLPSLCGTRVASTKPAHGSAHVTTGSSPVKLAATL